MTMPARGKSHLFIGLVDKVKYKPEYLSINIRLFYSVDVLEGLSEFLLLGCMEL